MDGRRPIVTHPIGQVAGELTMVIAGSPANLQGEGGGGGGGEWEQKMNGRMSAVTTAKLTAVRPIPRHPHPGPPLKAKTATEGAVEQPLF